MLKIFISEYWKHIWFCFLVLVPANVFLDFKSQKGPMGSQRRGPLEPKPDFSSFTNKRQASSPATWFHKAESWVKATQFRTIGQSGKKCRFEVCGVWGTIFIVNVMKRLTQKLRRAILLHFGLISFRFRFRKTRKPIICMVVWFLYVPMLPKTNCFKLWTHQITQNN